MASYRIVCTEQIPFSYHPSQAKIVAVGTGDDPYKAAERFTVEEVVSLMDQGHFFYTKGLTSGKIAYVEKYWCSTCQEWHIRTEADAVTDNNLDSLRYCNWKAA